MRSIFQAKPGFAVNMFIFLMLMITTSRLSSQHATNFSVNDCSGVPYDLFEELDKGKVIVLCWVMPCGPCIAPAQAAYNATMSYAATHPGLVEMYVIDDYANTSCNDLNNWCYVYGLDTTVRFSDNSIRMTDYGSVGMPKTVVVGGVWRKVYFNQNNGVNASLLKDAIDLALTETSVHENSRGGLFSVSIYPNPLVTEASLEIELQDQTHISVDLYNLQGQIVANLYNGVLNSGTNKLPVYASNLNSGIYYVRIATPSWHETLRMSVSK